MGYPENSCSRSGENYCVRSGESHCCRSARQDGCCGLARRDVPCILYAFWFLVGVAVIAVSLLLGAVFYETFLPASAAVIAFSAAVAAIAIALLIYYKCRKRC